MSIPLEIGSATEKLNLEQVKSSIYIGDFKTPSLLAQFQNHGPLFADTCIVCSASVLFT